MDKSTFIIDIDDTISQTPLDEQGNGLYQQAKPLHNVIKKIRLLYQEGHMIVLFTARGMRTYKGDVEKIKKNHQDTLVSWLNQNHVPYHELIFGKPWGPNVYYIDDKSLTINQFLLHNQKEYADVVHYNSWWRRIKETNT